MNGWQTKYKVGIYGLQIFIIYTVLFYKEDPQSWLSLMQCAVSVMRGELQILGVLHLYLAVLFLHNAGDQLRGSKVQKLSNPVVIDLEMFY